MNGKDLSRQLGDLPEDMIAEAMAPAKTLHRKQVTARALRLAAVAAVVLLAFMTLYFPIGKEPASPYFSLYVYANEAGSSELDKEYSLITPNGPYTFNGSGLGSGHPFFNSNITPVENPDAIFQFDIIPDESIRSIVKDRCAVFCNGEQVEFNSTEWAKDPSAPYIRVDQLRSPDPDMFAGYCVHGILEEEAVIEIVLYDKDGNILQSSTVLVQPVEGGYNISLKDFYVAESD